MRIVNRNVFRNYHILERIEAGIKLTGVEVKSIRASRVNLSKSFAKIQNEEAYLINMYIPHTQTSAKNYDPARSRKLLLHKDQIKSLTGKLSAGKMALVPVAIYEKNNLFKIELGLAKSKREFDKRRATAARDHIRRVEQELRGKE